MSMRPRQPIIKQSNYYTENVYTQGEIGPVQETIDFERTSREDISLYLLHRLIYVSFVSTCINAMLQILCFVLSCLKVGV